MYELQGYVDSKSATERELLEFGARQVQEGGGGLEVVTLACGLIVGDTLHCCAAETTIITFSQFIHQDDAQPFYHALRFLEELDGKVPLVHIHDVCDAHIFCMEQSSLHGRFLCASSFLSSSDIATYYRLHHPQLQQKYGSVSLSILCLIDCWFITKCMQN